jgi:hypothetical protein
MRGREGIPHRLLRRGIACPCTALLKLPLSQLSGYRKVEVASLLWRAARYDDGALVGPRG